MSISPSAHRQLRSSTRSPARSRYSAATCSPSRPSSSLAFTGHHLHTDSAGGGGAPAERPQELWIARRECAVCRQFPAIVGARCFIAPGDVRATKDPPQAGGHPRPLRFGRGAALLGVRDLEIVPG